MKKSVLTFLAAAVMVVAGTAQAVELSGNVAITNDYVWRGISQTMEDPAIQGGFDLAAEGFYAGIWGSNVNFGGVDESTEFDLYFGYGGDITDTVSYDVGFIRYEYPGITAVSFNEIYASLSAMGATVGLAFDEFDNIHLNLGYDLALPNDFGLGFGYATYRFDMSAADYDHYSITLSKSAGGFDFSLAWIDTDGNGLAAGALGDSRVVFAIAKSL